MEAPLSQTSSHSSSSGIRKVFSKNKLRAGSTPSFDDSLQPRSSTNSPERSPTRISIDSSRDGSSKSGGSGFGKLISDRVKRSKRRRRASELKQLGADEERGYTPEADTLGLDSQSNANKSTSTLANEGDNSLLTDDSDLESTRPGITPHDSHVGYLTTSSPLINTTTVNAPASTGIQSTNTSQIDGPLHAVTESDAQSVKDPLTASASSPDVASISEPRLDLSPSRVDSLAVPDSERPDRRRSSISNSIRAKSPGRKIKEAFTLTGSNKESLKEAFTLTDSNKESIKEAFSRTGSSKASNVSPDRASTTSGGSGALDGRISKQGSITSRRQAQGGSTTAVLPQIDTTLSDKSADPKSDLPAQGTAQDPKTPPSSGLSGPLTTVTPPTPTDTQPTSASATPRDRRPEWESNGIVVSHSGNMISHRRAKSEQQPSKLSNVVSAPLTPTVEESKTPGSSKEKYVASGAGFFSSWVSAAQNAANQISSTINTGNRSRSGTQNTEPEKPKQLEPTPEEDEVQTEPPERKPLAVETLGMGDLNFSHLGLDTSSDEKPPDSADQKQNPTSLRDEAAARLEDARAARAVSAAYEKPARDPSAPPVAEDTQSVIRHRDTITSTYTGDRTPPNGSIFEGELGLGTKRSNSSSSRLGRRRNRGSSGATGQSAIGALIGGSTSTLAHPAAGPKVTGFAVASKVRNRNFHQLFRSVPEDDYLIEDYSSALQRDILLAGRIYVSEGHICFSSNILGWVTTLVISFEEVMSIEKEATAMVFPNAIAVQTLHARHTFRSLLSRDATYDLMIGIWKVSHPGTFKTTLNGVPLESGTGDKTEKTGDSPPSGDEFDEEEMYDEDEDEDDAGSFPDTAEGASITGSEFSAPLKPINRKPSALNNNAAANATVPYPPMTGDLQQGEKLAASMFDATGTDFPGPSTHIPTDCMDSATHFEKVVKDEVIPAPLGKIYTMLFGPNSPVFVSKFLLEEQKVSDLVFDDKKGLSNDNKSRQYSYTKPLGGSIGPRQTKCITTENLDFFELEKAVSVTCTTQTPDVPSGNAFSVKTRYCLSWAPGNGTRIQMNCGIEWTAKSWLKGPIEKGAIDGQLSYGNELVKSLKSGVSSRTRGLTGASRVSKKGRKRKGDSKSTALPKTNGKVVKSENPWGIFNPLHSLLSPIVGIMGPLFSVNSIIIVLLCLLIFTWIRGPPRSSTSSSANGLTSSSTRLAAYEEMWQREESDLWQWLEERLGLDQISVGLSAADHSSSSAMKSSKENDKKAEAQNKERGRILSAKDMAARLREEKMSEREVDDAIRVTQERLNILKGVVDKKKATDGTSSARRRVNAAAKKDGGVSSGTLPVEDRKVEL